MSANTVFNYHDTCSALSRSINDLDVRIKMSARNQQIYDTYTENIKKLETNIRFANEVIDEIKPLLEDVMKYVTERRKESMQNINNALRIAGEIIPDSGEGIYFKLDGDEAWLSTHDGLEVDATEGGGYRQISSTFIRSVILNANHDVLSLLMLDEIFSLVSEENSARLSMYLNVMCQDTQVISIEQKPQVYSNIDNVTYIFSNNNDFAEVIKETIKREDMKGEK